MIAPPRELPDVASLEAAADAIDKAAKQFHSTMTTIEGTWNGLPAYYTAPEQETVFAAMKRPGLYADSVRNNAASVKTALLDYATAVNGLKTRRAAIMTDYDDLAKKPETDADYSSREMGLGSTISTYEMDLATADSDCAAALTRLEKYGSTIPSDLLTKANSPYSGGAQGLAAELMTRYRSVAVPGPGSTVDIVPHIEQLIPDVMFQGKPYVYAANGSLVPLNVEASKINLTPTIDTKGAKWNTHVAFSGDAEVGSAPGWAKAGGKALLVVGAVLEYSGAYNDQYNEDLEKHPDWNPDQRTGSAVENAAFVGTAGTAGGALAGAAGGMLLGAAIGSIFPGPGTVIGGVIGGIAGGLLGSHAGEDLGKSMKETWNGLFG